MPAIFSHYNGRAAFVCDVVTTGIRNLLQRRLTAQASAELLQLEELLLDVSLDESHDQRVSFFQDDNRRLMSGLIYRASTRGDQPCPAFKFVWRNFAPPRG